MNINAAEEIRKGLRLLEAENQKIIALRKAIEEGERSGKAKNFEPKTHLVKLKSKKK